MRKSLIKIIILFNLLFSFSQAENTKVLLTGFNVNWSFLPQLNKQMIERTIDLKPKVIRYPGGTVSKTWDWEKGKTSKPGKRSVHTLDDLASIKKATKADVIFVLNTISSTLEKQLELLRTAKSIDIPIKYIEMGNEHYLGSGKNVDDSGKHQDNVEAFPTGKEYAIFVNKWAKKIKKEFPSVKLGITMIGRSTKGVRQRTWNDSIVDNIDNTLFDAYIYHIYIHDRKNKKLNKIVTEKMIQKRIDDFEKIMIDDSSKEIWITEYGVHTSTEKRTVLLTNELANYIDSIATISTPQVLYRKPYNGKEKKFFSLLTNPDGAELTELGKMFAKRAK